MGRSPDWGKEHLPPNLDPAIIAFLRGLSDDEWKTLNKVRHGIEDLNKDDATERTAKAQIV